MARRSSTRNLDVLLLIQIACATLLILTGIQAVAYYDSTAGEVTRFFQKAVGKNDYAVNITMGIITIACGGVLALSIFMRLPFRPILAIATAAVWSAMAIYVLFIRANAFEENTLVGFSELAQRAMIAVILWSAK